MNITRLEMTIQRIAKRSEVYAQNVLWAWRRLDGYLPRMPWWWHDRYRGFKKTMPKMQWRRTTETIAYALWITHEIRWLWFRGNGIYSNCVYYSLERGKSCQNVQIARHTHWDQIRNGILDDSRSRCTNAPDAEINLENISRKTRCNLCWAHTTVD